MLTIQDDSITISICNVSKHAVTTTLCTLPTHQRFVFKIWSYFSFTGGRVRQPLLQCVLDRRYRTGKVDVWFNNCRIIPSRDFRSIIPVPRTRGVISDLVCVIWVSHGLRFPDLLAHRELLRWLGEFQKPLLHSYGKFY